MKEEEIYLVDYDPSWVDKFQKEKKLIEHTLGNRITGGVHHFGSTAVPGLKAKPIIDIMVGIENLEKAKEYIPLLEKIDYQYFPYKSDEMLWFCKPSPYKRTHHLHMLETTHPQWKARIAFRDYLREHPETKDKYEKLKIDLAEKFRDDREAYTEAKTTFIKKIVLKSLGKNYPFE